MSNSGLQAIKTSLIPPGLHAKPKENNTLVDDAWRAAAGYTTSTPEKPSSASQRAKSAQKGVSEVTSRTKGASGERRPKVNKVENHQPHRSQADFPSFSWNQTDLGSAIAATASAVVDGVKAVASAAAPVVKDALNIDLVGAFRTHANPPLEKSAETNSGMINSGKKAVDFMLTGEIQSSETNNRIARLRQLLAKAASGQRRAINTSIQNNYQAQEVSHQLAATPEAAEAFEGQKHTFRNRVLHKPGEIKAARDALKTAYERAQKAQQNQELGAGKRRAGRPDHTYNFHAERAPTGVNTGRGF